MIFPVQRGDIDIVPDITQDVAEDLKHLPPPLITQDVAEDLKHLRPPLRVLAHYAHAHFVG